MENISFRRCPLPARPDWPGPDPLFPVLAKELGQIIFQRVSPKGFPWLPSCNMSLVSPSNVLDSARNSIGARETSSEGVPPWSRALQTPLATGSSFIKGTQQPEHHHWYFPHTALLSCKGTHAIRIYVSEAFHSTFLALHSPLSLSPPPEAKREAEISGLCLNPHSYRAYWALFSMHKTPKLTPICLFILLSPTPQ